MAGKGLIGSLYANLSLDTAAFNKGVEEAQGTLGKLGSAMKKIALPVAAFGGSLIAAGGKAAKLAAEIKQQAELANAGAVEFQKMAAAARTVGVDQGKLADILKDSQEKIGNFIATGGGEFKDFMEDVAPAIGLTTEKLKEMSGPEALQAVYDGLERTGKSRQEITAYLEALASDASALAPLLADNGAELERIGSAVENNLFSEQSVEAGAKMQEAMTKLSTAFTAVGNALIETGLVDKIAQLLIYIADGIPKVVELTQGFVTMANEVVQVVSDMVTGIWEQMVGRFDEIVGYVQDKVAKITGFFSGMYDAVVGNSYVPDMVDGIIGEFARLARVAVPEAAGITGRIADSFRTLAVAAVDSTRSIKDAFKQIGIDLAYTAIQGLLGQGPFGGALALPPFRAMGGPVAARSPYIVGERGPELFVPRGAGDILPNGAAVAGGDVSIVVENHGPPMTVTARREGNLVRIIQSVVSGDIAGGGPIDRVMQRRYRVQPALTGRS